MSGGADDAGTENPDADGGEGGGERTVLVDAGAFITLAAVDAVDLLTGLDGDVVVPERVADELVDDRSATALANARERGRIRVVRAESRLGDARSHLGVSGEDRQDPGDVGLLACALDAEQAVAVTDDKPLRDACKALSIPVSGSIGVLVRAVERGHVEADEAVETLYAMDEVGARLSASLVRRAVQLIENAED
jgi:predicted nucleic acid-binding protein